MRRSTTLLAILLLLVSSTSLSAWGWGDDRVKETETFERTVEASTDGTVSVETTNGNIEVETWDRAEVKIWAEKNAQARNADDARAMLAETEIRVDQSTGRVTIEADLPNRNWKRGGVSVSFRLTVPRGAHVAASSTNGNVRITELGGLAEVETTNGNIRLRDIGGDVNASTVNGGIDARGIGGRLEAQTTNGSIDAEVTSASLAGDMSLETTNGSIDLALSSALAAEIDARAGNGRVSHDLAGDVQRETRRALEMTMNGGGPRIEVRTSNGRIHLNDVR